MGLRSLKGRGPLGNISLTPCHPLLLTKGRQSEEAFWGWRDAEPHQWNDNPNQRNRLREINLQPRFLSAWRWVHFVMLTPQTWENEGCWVLEVSEKKIWNRLFCCYKQQKNTLKCYQMSYLWNSITLKNISCRKYSSRKFIETTCSLSFKLWKGESASKPFAKFHKLTIWLLDRNVAQDKAGQCLYVLRLDESEGSRQLL